MRKHFTDKDKTRKSFNHRRRQGICKTKKDIQLDILLQIPAASYFPRQLPTKYHQR